MVKFSCNTADLRTAVEHIRVALPKSRMGQTKARVEISIQPTKTTLSVIGASYSFDWAAGFFAKVYMPVLPLLRAAEITTASIFSMECEDRKVRFAGMEISSPHIVLVHPENQDKIDLSMNHTVQELLQMCNEHTVGEIKRMGLLAKVQRHEKQMISDVQSAFAWLKPYGVTFEELKGLIDRKLNR